MIGQRGQATPRSWHAFESPRNRTMLWGNFDFQKLAIDRFARQAVAKAKAILTDLIDELEIPRPAQGRDDVAGRHFQCGGEQIEVKPPSDERRLGDDATFGLVHGRKPLQERRADRFRQLHALSGSRHRARLLDRAF